MNHSRLEYLFRQARKELDKRAAEQAPLLSNNDIELLLKAHKPQTVVPSTSSQKLREVWNVCKKYFRVREDILDG
jgi:hypothetical protein